MMLSLQQRKGVRHLLAGQRKERQLEVVEGLIGEAGT